MSYSDEVTDEAADEVQRARANVEAAWLDMEKAMGTRIRGVRERRGLSQAQLSDLVKSRGFNLHQTAIAKIEAGKRPLRVGEFFALSDCLGFTPMGLFYLPEVAIAPRPLKELDALLAAAHESARESEGSMLQNINDLITIHVGNESRKQLLAMQMRIALQREEPAAEGSPDGERQAEA